MSDTQEKRVETDSRYATLARVMLGGLLLLLVSQAVTGVLVVRATQEPGRRVAQVAKVEQQVKADEQRIGSERVQLVEACKRLQVVRIEDNISHFADWRAFRFFAALPGLPAPARDHLIDALSAKSWVPLTNCRRAVAAHGARYAPPRPVAFNRALPPSSALTLTPALFTP